MKQVTLRLGSSSYDILIGSGLLMQTGAKLKELGFSDKLIIITDPTVKTLYGNTLKQSLSAVALRY